MRFHKWQAVVAIAVVVGPGVAAARNGRHTIVISDTHFGVGHVAGTKTWDSYEDARFPSDLISFVEYTAAQAQGNGDLVINGDAFELWQSRDIPCGQKDLNLGCSEDEARRRFKQVLAAHAPEMKALGKFARQDANRLVIVVGNHDAAVLLPGMEKLLRDGLEVQDGHLELARTGVWESADKMILAEHGHEIPSDPNAFEGWPTPIVKRGEMQFVKRPWGEQFVQEFYNRYESKFPIIDNFTNDAAGIRYVLKAEGLVGSVVGVGAFLKFLVFRESWKQFASVLGGEAGSSAWDLPAERKKGGQFLAESFPSDDPIRATVTPNRDELDKFVKDHKLLTDAEMSEICDARWKRSKETPNIRPCVGTLGGEEGTLGAIGDSLLRKRDARITQRIASLKKKPRVFIYSHTHAVDEFEIAELNNLRVLNTGAWQRLVTKEEFEKMAAGKNAVDVFRKASIESLAACYPFVMTPPYAKEPAPVLMKWTIDEKGQKGVAAKGVCH